MTPATSISGTRLEFLATRRTDRKRRKTLGFLAFLRFSLLLTDALMANWTNLVDPLLKPHSRIVSTGHGP
jgi:hypothetical protein